MRRTWQIGPYRGESGDYYPLDPGELDREMVALGVQLSRMGGSAVVAPLRIKYRDGFVTVGMAIKYDSGNVPAAPAAEGSNGTRAAEPQGAEDEPQAAEPVPDPPEPQVQLPEPPLEAEREPALTE